nr:unnamed protein product [Digitaria exilis]
MPEVAAPRGGSAPEPARAGGVTLKLHHGGQALKKQKARESSLHTQSQAQLNVEVDLKVLVDIWPNRNSRLEIETILEDIRVLSRDMQSFKLVHANRSFHVDDSEVTLNVCLGKQFSGGELYFRGIRCENHVNSETQHEVQSCGGNEHQMDLAVYAGRKCMIILIFPDRLYSTMVDIGMVLELHHLDSESICFCGAGGIHAFPSSILLSVFREMKKYQKDFPSWCGECQRGKRERQSQCVKATKMAFLRGSGGAMI